MDDFSGLMEIGGAICSTLDRKVLLNNIMDITKKLVCAEASSLFLVSNEKGELVYEVALGDKGDEVKELKLKMGEGIAGWVALNGEPLVIDDVNKDKRFCSMHDAESGFKTKTIACVPVIIDKKIIGVLEAINPVNRESFSQKDLKLLEIISTQAAIAIKNANLHEELMKKQRFEFEMDIAPKNSTGIFASRIKRAGAEN